jgi:hypothetical protein
VTLTKLREAVGRVLYVTQSAYLAQSARGLYGAHGYENGDQEVEFLSYREFLETIQVPAGSEVRLADFEPWFNRNRATLRDVPDADGFALFEEFRGVIGARPDALLSLDEYHARRSPVAVPGRHRAGKCAYALRPLRAVAEAVRAL